MVNVLLVHGRSRPLFGPAQMREQWLVALASGFESAGLAMPFRDEDVLLPWYGDVLGQLVGGASRAEAERISLRGDMPKDERAFVRDVVAQVAGAYGFSAAQLASVAAPGEEDKVTPQAGWAYVRNVLGAVDRYVPGMSGATVAFVARECFGYAADGRLRGIIDDAVAGAGRADEPTVVVGHSLGAVIAYHVLRSHAAAEGWRVPLFLTLGSPLAWAPVATALARLNTPRIPIPVAEWVNVRDRRDAVAIGGDVVGAFLPEALGRGAVVEESGIVNPDDGRHAIEYYLADPVVAGHLARVATAA